MIGLVSLVALGIALVVVGSMTLLGGNVSEVFNEIDEGLGTTGLEAPPTAALDNAEYAAREEYEEREDGMAGGGSDMSSTSNPGSSAPAVEKPAATSSPSAADVSSEEDELAAGEPLAEADGTGEEVEDAEGGPRPRPHGRPAPLKAGEIDDNAQFESYLEYLDTYQGPPARTVDVSERYLITVLDNNQQPVLDAHVRIYAGEQQVFEGRTYAGGKTVFLPNVAEVSENATEFQIVAEYENNTARKTVQRTSQDHVELALENDLPPLDELQLDVLFLLDTTGSMGDELGRIQETIDSIAQRINSFVPRPTVRFAVVAYRDRSDQYVTRSYDFTSDVEQFRTLLNSFSADGGGDTPEALNEALHEAIQEVTWSDQSVRLIFLVADAGPHLDYEQDYDYITETRQAVAQGIKVYPIAASNTDDFAEYVFRQLAQQTLARFIFLTYQPGQNEGLPGESTTLEAGEQPYTVERLDDLIVQVVQHELAAATGLE
jgi:Mg-chelatase subunit ChlD